MKRDKKRPMESKPTHQPSQPPEQQPGQPQPNRPEDRAEQRRQDSPLNEHPGERSDREAGAGRPVQLDQIEGQPVK